MGSACEWPARTDAQERIKAQSVTMIGPSVYLVRLLGTMVLRNVGTAIAVLVGCFSAGDQASSAKLSTAQVNDRSQCEQAERREVKCRSSFPSVPASPPLLSCHQPCPWVPPHRGPPLASPRSASGRRSPPFSVASGD